MPLAEVVPSARGGAALLGVSVPAWEPGPSVRAAGEEPEWVGVLSLPRIGDGLESPPVWAGSLLRVGAGLLSPARAGVSSPVCDGVLSLPRVGEGLESPVWEGVPSLPRVGAGLLSLARDGVLSPVCDGVLSLPRVGDGLLSPPCEGSLLRVVDGLASPVWDGDRVGAGPLSDGAPSLPRAGEELLSPLWVGAPSSERAAEGLPSGASSPVWEGELSPSRPEARRDPPSGVESVFIGSELGESPSARPDSLDSPRDPSPSPEWEPSPPDEPSPSGESPPWARACTPPPSPLGILWTKPPSLTFNPSRPETLPRTFPNTFAIFSKTSTSFDSSGDTFRMVSVSFLSSSPIFFPHLAIAADACATTTGVPKPREKTSSITHAISFPTRSAISCRTVSRTNDTTWPMIIVTVLIAPATVAAPDNASECSAANLR
ncbi:hypothetical protein [Amycolatopsis lexingtonensis]|uniref:hypothetical protein n=1 Tax=Amycolatopsis lexingtonensis TaxID=218822 RepID=UPI003F716610